MVTVDIHFALLTERNAFLSSVTSWVDLQVGGG